MRRYERYLFMHLLLPTVLVTAALTGIIWLTQALRFIDYMINRGLSISDFLYLTGLMLPSLLLLLIPISLGIAVVYTYHRLTADSELVVLNAIGVSKLQLTRPALLLGAIVCVICYMLVLLLLPVANQKFRDIHIFFRDKYASVLLEEEVFNTPIDGVTVFVRARDSKGNLADILLHDNRNPVAITMMAKRGRMEQTESGPRFYLEDGVRQQIEDGRVSWLSFDNYTIDIGFYTQDVARVRDPDEFTFSELLRGDPAHPKQDRAMHAELHHRILWPLFSLVLPLVALAVLSAGEFNRRGQWKRIVKAISAIVVVVILFFAVRNMIAGHPWLTPALYLLMAGVAASSCHLLASGRWWWRSAYVPSMQT